MISPTPSAAGRPSREANSPQAVPSMTTPSRLANAVIPTIKNTASASTHSIPCPKFAPTRDAVSMLPGPQTTAATMSAGPSDRTRPGLEVTLDELRAECMVGSVRDARPPARTASVNERSLTLAKGRRKQREVPC
jgi:hypothetical protein